MGMRRFFLDGITWDRGSQQAMRCFGQGVLFTDGTIALRPLHSPNPGSTVVQTQFFHTLDHMRGLYPSETVKIRWWDKVCFACGSTADRNEGPGGCSQCGASWDEPVDEKNPSLGRWTPAAEFNGDA